MIYISDGSGDFYSVVDYKEVINELLKSSILKEVYIETKFSTQIETALRDMVNMEILECVGERPDYSVEELMESTATLRASVVEHLGEAVAAEADKEVDARWESLKAKQKE